jgi:hypothetical protein
MRYAVKLLASCISIDINCSFVVAVVIKPKDASFDLSV